MITSIRTEGPAPISYYDTGNGINATIGTLSGDCNTLRDGSEVKGPTTLIVTITPNEGGLLTFRYQFQTWGYTSSNNVDGVYFDGDGFSVRVHPWEDGWYWSSSLREAEYWSGVPGCERLADTGWVDSSIYIFPDDRVGDVEVRFTLGNDGKGDQAFVELESISLLCDPESASKSWLGSSSMPELDYVEIPQHQHHRRRSARSEASGVRIMAACKGCCVSALTPLPGNDADSSTMEASYDPWAWAANLTTELAAALNCLNSKVTFAGGIFRLTSSYRTAWYQVHLREVWDKYVALKNNNEAACAALKQEVTAEMNKHALKFEPAGTTDPRHVSGEAIDLKYRTHDTGIPEADFLAYADQCNLYRRVPKDKVHFEVKP